MHVGEGDRADKKFPRVGRWNFGLGPPGWGSGFGGRGFETRGRFLLRLPAASLGAAVVLGSDF